MTPNGLISQALALQASYYVLDGAKKNGDLPDDRNELITSGLYQSSIILLVFATEIALKGILRLKVGNFAKTHNLKKLYDFIPPEIRDRISEIYKSKLEQVDSTLESLFEEHKNLFTDFRYLDGSLHIEPNPQLLCEAVNSIVDYYNEVKDD